VTLGAFPPVIDTPIDEQADRSREGLDGRRREAFLIPNAKRRDRRASDSRTDSRTGSRG